MTQLQLALVPQLDHCVRSTANSQRVLAEAGLGTQPTEYVSLPGRAQRTLFCQVLHPLRDLNPQSSD